jgi:arginase
MRIDVIQVPYDGAHRAQRHGRGPLHLIETGFLEYLGSREHEVRLIEVESAAPFATDAGTTFELARLISHHVRAAKESGRFPLVLAGNCGSSIGTVAGLGGSRVGVVWFDAHGDFNTPEISPSGFLDGMALSVLTGRCWRALAETVPGFEPVPESQVVLVGIRDLDPEEAIAIERSSVRVVRGGVDRPARTQQVVEREVEDLGRLVRAVYLHVDLDILDPGVVRANHFAAPGGFTVGELREMIDGLRSRMEIEAVALTSYDPTLDPEERMARIGFDIIETVLK